jgi:hypothetical protein
VGVVAAAFAFEVGSCIAVSMTASVAFGFEAFE